MSKDIRRKTRGPAGSEINIGSILEVNTVRPNNLKVRLKEGKLLIGCLLAYNAPWLVEVLGTVGYDFVAIDLEHEPIDNESVANLIRAADGVNLPSLVRMPCTERLLPFLDAGVHGVIVPDIRDRQHAEKVVEMTRFYPIGCRTYYTQTRSANYGVGIDERTWTQETNERQLVLGMIESISAVEKLDGILAVQGIDGYHIGPLDLAQSMGYPPKAELERLIEDVVRRCRAAGKYVAVGVVTPWGMDSLPKWAQQGAQIFNVPSAWMLTHMTGQFLGEVRSLAPAGQQGWPPIPSIAHNPYFTSDK
jgi:2-keto-3-deoxy-L-rhamnonate aldolase RhmA